MPYDLENNIEGKELSRVKTSPLDSLNSEANMAVGMRNFTIFTVLFVMEQKGMVKVPW